MLDCGAIINSTDSTERTALHYLVKVDETGEFTKWLMSLEKVKSKINVNAVTRGNETPLMLATKFENLVMVEELLKKGANPFLRNLMG